MIGLDTNILVRFLVRDDEAQHAAVVAALRRGAELAAPILRVVGRRGRGPARVR